MASVARYCCCGGECVEAGVTCGNCGDVTPQQFDLTISGVTLCTSCGEISTGSWTKVVSGSINGAHTLTLGTSPASGNCEWGVTYSDLFVVGSYSSETDCNNDSGSEYDSDVTIRLIKNSTTWQLEILAILDIGFGATTDAQIFCGSVTASTSGGPPVQVCSSVPSIGNNLGTCAELGSDIDCPAGSADVFAIGTGGTATASCVEV